MEDFLGCRVAFGLAEVVVDGKPLRCTTEAKSFQSLVECGMIERNGNHQAAEFLNRRAGQKDFRVSVSRSQLSAGNYFHIVRTLDSPVNSLINCDVGP